MTQIAQEPNPVEKILAKIKRRIAFGSCPYDCGPMQDNQCPVCKTKVRNRMVIREQNKGRQKYEKVNIHADRIGRRNRAEQHD